MPNDYPTGKDFWVTSKGQYTEPTFIKYEGEDHDLLRQIAYKHVKQWRGCVDAGANVGMWTRSLMQDFETVYCFEPNPVFIECWHKNIPADKNAILNEVGLGETESTANFALPLDQQLQRKPGSIKIKTLDSYELNNIDFIKIDVDGYEDLLLKGAKETLTNNDPVINIEMKRSKRQKVCEVADKILRQLGFRPRKRTNSEEVWIKSDKDIFTSETWYNNEQRYI